MPVITRNQSKQMKEIIMIQENRNNEFKSAQIKSGKYAENKEYEKNVTWLIHDLIHKCESAKGKLERMLISLQVYNIINDNLEKFLHNNQAKWLKFAATVYNKTTEFIENRNSNVFDDIDTDLVDTFTNAFMKARKFISLYFKNIRGLNSQIINSDITPFKEMFDDINEEDSKVSRPRRNIPVVDYTGMDTIELESEYDCITDIWYDQTKTYDSDYNPEEEDDEGDDEEWCDEY
jgi:hypothetical protein